MAGTKHFAALMALCILAGFFVPPAMSASQSSKEHGWSSNFSRPFKVLSDSKIVSFLSENPSISLALDDFRFFRFSSDHQQLVRGLIVPLLFDQRAVMMFARLHSLTDINLDPALDALIDAIDESPWVEFMVYFVAAPSYPIYETLSNMSSESSFDEWFRLCFLFCSLLEVVSFFCSVYDFVVIYDELKWQQTQLLHSDVFLRGDFLLNFVKRIGSSLLDRLIYKPSLVAFASLWSYCVLWNIAGPSFCLLISNAQMFSLPAWYIWGVYHSVKFSWHCFARFGTTEEQLKKKTGEVKILAEAKKELSEKVRKIREQIEKKEGEIEVEKQECLKQIKFFEEQIEEEKRKKSAANSDSSQKLQDVIRQKEEADKNLRDIQQKKDKEVKDLKEKLKEANKSQQENDKKHEIREQELINILKTRCIPSGSVTFVETLDRGGFGCVYKAKMFGKDVAVKFMNPNNDSQAELMWPLLMREISIMKQLTHPNIVNFIGCIESQASQSRKFDIPDPINRTHRLPAVVLELADAGNLQKYWRNPAKPMLWKDRYDFALQLAKGLEYLHNQNPPVIHNDIKPPNVLVFKDGAQRILKFTDFGISGRGKGELTGTQYWMAPEISTADGNPASSCEHNEKTDVWAFGLMMLFLLIGRNPIQDVPTFRSFKSQKDHWQEPLECDKRPYADEDVYKQVMNKCLQEVASQRPTMAQVRDALETKKP